MPESDTPPSQDAPPVALPTSEDSPTRMETLNTSAFADLQALLGSCYPSLPRILECYPPANDTPPRLLLASLRGEPLLDYCQRVGPLPLVTACALTYRLSCELEALEEQQPAATARLNPLNAIVSVWQEEFVQLRLGGFDLAEKKPEAVAQSVRLLQVCRHLIAGGVSPLPDAVASNIPSMLLMKLRQIDDEKERAALSWTEIKNLLLDTIATHSRTIRGTGMTAHLALQPRLLPQPFSATTAPPGDTVRLSRLLAHRESLGEGEIVEMLKRVTRSLETPSEKPRLLDPRCIWIKLPAAWDATNLKSLDMRLDSGAAYAVSLQSPAATDEWTSSPISALEAEQHGRAFEDLRGDIDRQQARLVQVLLNGTYGLRAFDAAIYHPSSTAEASRLPRPLPTHRPEGEGTPASAEEVPATPAAAEAPATETTRTHTPMQTPGQKGTDRRLKPIVLTLGSGGTGKSMLSRLLYDFANLEHRVDMPLFDCDVEGNRDFQKIAPQRIRTLETASTELIRTLVGTASAKQPVLADLPSSCLQRFASELSADVVRLLLEDAGVTWLPVHLVTARASSIPVLHSWRKQVWGDLPAVIVISQKDGQVPSGIVEQVLRPQDTLIRLPALDTELASATDLSATTWLKLLQTAQGAFANPLLRLQLKRKRDEFEQALRPLVALLAGEAA